MHSRPMLVAALLCARAWAQPATLSGFSDEGTFLLYANEERIARLTFQWKPDGSFQSSVTISLAGQSTTGTVVLTPDAEGRWKKAVVEGFAKRSVWERDGKTIRFATSKQQGDGVWPENSVVFESWTPPLISLALRRYNAAEGGQQNLPVMQLTSNVFDNPNLGLERQDTIERTVDGRHLRLTRWLYSPQGSEYHVLADQDGRVYLVSGVGGFGGGIAEQNTWFVREGYEALRELPREAGPISMAKFDVERQAGVWVPMRDGVKLSTDLYLPAGAGKAPVILIRTPYKKEMEEIVGRFYARRGYVVAVQDVRGRFGSQGEWEPCVHEARDGYDTIEWLALQPWSSGKVGMIGASYLGWVQWLAASLHPPHLAAMIPNVSLPDPFHNMPFDSGSLLLQGSIHWSDRVETNSTGDISGALEAAIDRKNLDELLKPLPVIDAYKAVLGKESTYWRRWMMHPTPDSYWKDSMFADKLKTVDIPVFHQSGWFDGDGVGTKLNYLKMASFGHTKQKLTVGPWGHTDSANRGGDDRDFGEAASIDLQHEYLRWFDHWLKGMDNGIAKEPPVALFVMGSNRWMTGSAYPLPETQFEKLYLTGDGSLSFTAPDAAQPPDHYVYDPGDPTPDGRTGIEKPRKDILVYTTAPFEKPYTIAGPVSAVLFAATSARDTDWFVHLFDVDEKGKRSPLWSNGSGGHIRARYRNSLTKAELLQAGRVYRYNIDMWHTAIALAPGHRLRVEVSSAQFPTFDRNLNTGGNNETETRFVSAEQTIYHDAQHASYILLPKIPEK